MSNWTPEQMAEVLGDWSARKPDQYRNALAIVTAGLVNDDVEQRKLLAAALTPVVSGGVVMTFGTMSALVAMMVRSINTIARLTGSEPRELWEQMATELEAEIISQLDD